MKCIICGEETSGSIGGKDICPLCDRGTMVQMNYKTGKLEKLVLRYAPACYYRSHDHAIELLKEMEWSGFHSDDEDSWAVMTRACPVCMNRMDKGHKDSCRLKELIT